MPDTWVVGVDGSTCAEHAAQWAATHATGRADTVRLVSAWSIPPAPALPPVGPFARTWDVDCFDEAAIANVRAVAEQLEPHCAVPIECVVERGHSSSVLLAASENEALLVVGSRGRGGFQRLILGSTSTQCANHAHVPTVVIHADAQTTSADRIVVAVDGSPNAADAVRWAANFARANTRIDCVNVWDTTPIAVGSDQFSFPESSELVHERFEHHIETLRSDVTAGVELHSRFIEGRARTALAEAAADADLLVMGASGRGAVSSAVLGSVSNWLLHHVVTPMVVVPHAQQNAVRTDAR